MSHMPRTHRAALPLVALLLALAVPQPAAAQDAAVDDATDRGVFLQLEGHGTGLSAMVDRSAIEMAFGYGFRAGHRWGRWSAFLFTEHDLWLTTEHEREVVHGAFNVGIGGEVRWFEGRARSSLALGPSVLLFDTFLDEAGTTGFFVDVRPLGARWALGGGWELGVDPLSLSVLVPVASAIPLVKVEYRSSLYVGVEL